MKTVALFAKFDGEHIRLEETYPLKRNVRLLVTILPDVETEDVAFNEYWKGQGAEALSRAYGPNEPEYRLDMVREPNAEYGAR